MSPRIIVKVLTNYARKNSSDSSLNYLRPVTNKIAKVCFGFCAKIIASCPPERQRLRTLFKHSSLLHQAYTFREELTAIFNRRDTVSEAQTAIEAWIDKVQASPLDCYHSFIKTLQRYWTFILNYFKRRTSSGFVEGLNNKIKTIKRRCYGISTHATLFQRIWLDLQGRRHFFLSTP